MTCASERGGASKVLTAGDALELGEAAVHGRLPALEAGAAAGAGARVLPAHAEAARATLRITTNEGRVSVCLFCNG